MSNTTDTNAFNIPTFLPDFSSYFDNSDFEIAGAGHYADVYSVLLGKKKFAFKVLRRFSYSSEAELMKSFNFELMSWLEVGSHPNVLGLVGICYTSLTCPGLQPGFISEWQDNRDVTSYLKNHDADILDIIEGILKGLEHMHKKGVVHGDLRGGNILVSKQGVPKISDFGLSKLFGRESSSSGGKGTLRWMARELLEADSEASGPKMSIMRSTASDVWSSAMTILELYSGENPFYNYKTDPYVVQAIVRGVLPQFPGPLYRHWRKYESLLKSLCESCWVRDPQERPDVYGLLMRLRHFKSGVTDSASYIDEGQSLTPRARSLCEAGGLSEEIDAFGLSSHTEGLNLPVSSVQEPIGDELEQKPTIIDNHQIEVSVTGKDKPTSRANGMFDDEVIGTASRPSKKAAQEIAAKQAYGALVTAEAEHFIDMTESLGSRSKLVCSPVGFYLHKVKAGRGYVLVKVFSGLSPGLFSPADEKTIVEGFLKELALWKHHCSTNTFGTLLGRCDSVDSVLPCPTYQETVIAKDYVQDSQNINLLDFFLGIAKGLDHLHSKGLPHGDIRADNILVGSDGVPRIADFGLSRIRQMLDRMNLSTDADISPTRWMPVEIIRLDDSALYEPTIPGDVWSFGMTMFELWSGKQPYHDTRPERISVKIIQGILPSFSFPGNVKREFEVIRETVMFLCNLCWKEDPKDRKTIAELVHILRELVEGKPLRAIREEFDISETVVRSRQESGYAASSIDFSHGENSFANSNVSIFSEGGIFEVKEEKASSPDGFSSSRSDFNGSDRTAKGIKQPKMESYNGSSISSWSHSVNETHHENLNTSYQHYTDISRPPTNPSSASSTTPRPNLNNGVPRSYATLPPPPSPDSPWTEVISNKTMLLNYMAGKKKEAKIALKTTSEGEPHLLRFTSVSLIDGKEYGRSTNRTKKKAEEEAARQTIERLSAEDPSITSTSPPYLTKFKSYLAQHDLTNRIEWIYESDGEDHMLTWTCEIRRDGVDMAKGVASRKQDAAEQAAKKVAAIWARRI
ncbi:hypothetical protein EW145_g4230 [Phellinidium pouzarii]|uniref:Uncharacterized protein n=1 Tax=Phellinidium pouzarii TaxID=167371 RepID=A0A4S4L9E2_9AGAM|nr:hypothetical protein EW145_g4230 [Phellinidium pouzarii]